MKIEQTWRAIWTAVLHCVPSLCRSCHKQSALF